MIFVFGSNLAGRHGAGAALHARREHGAEYGTGHGPTGTAYAIPTKDERLRSLPLSRIKEYVNEFLVYTWGHSEERFEVTKIGCGLAGYTEADIAPMFAGAGLNCRLPAGWRDLAGAVDRPVELIEGTPIMRRLRMVDRQALITPEQGQAFRTEILMPADAWVVSVSFLGPTLYAWLHIPHDGHDAPATGMTRLLVLSSNTVTDIPHGARFVGTAIRLLDNYAVHVFDLGR